MSRHREPLNGGLVTNKDPALLEVGQLSDIRNATYRTGSQALQRARGRVAFATVSATAVDVVGLRNLQFDNGDHYLIAHASTIYASAFVGDSGTFGTLVSGLSSGSQLEACQFRNRYYLMNGAITDVSAAASNRVVYLSATAVSSAPQVRVHGLLPVESFPAITTAGGGAFSQSVTGYYEYWTTEVAKITQDGATQTIESTFVGNPTTVFVTATSVVPTIQAPLFRNALATHWRIYRSPKKDKESDRKFPTGFMIAEVASGTTAQADQSTVSNTGFVFPATFNSSAPFADFASASSMSSDNGVYASATVGALLSSKTQGCYGYNFGGFTGNVKGIEIEVQGYVQAGSAPCPVKVTIGKRKANGDLDRGILGVGGVFTQPIAAAMGTITSTAAGSPTTFTLGGSTSRWTLDSQPGFNDSDFNANFMTVVEVSKPNTTVGFDYIRAKVYYAGSVDSTVQFPTVVYTFGDISAQVGKNGPPPSSSTGDFFEDSLVVNDVSNPSLIRYSYPGDPEAFPSTYFIDFETRDNDQVKCIKVVNQRLIVGLTNSTWRANYLPSERDASFDRGKAIEPISRTFGIVNPMCACTYSPNGITERLAFVSLKGIHSTDGFDFEDVADVDWRTIIPVTTTATPVALINNPEENEIIFYYRNDTGTENYRALHLSYDPDHQTGNGTLKVSGPVNMRNFDVGSSGVASLKSAWGVPRTSGDTSLYLGYGGTSTAAGAGKVFIASGTAIPAEDPSMGYTTRRMYLAGEANEWRMNEVFGYSTISGSQALLYTVKNTKTDDVNGEVSGSVKNKTVGAQKLHKTNLNQMCEGARISMSVTAGHDEHAAEFLIIDGDDFGEEGSGKT